MLTKSATNISNFTLQELIIQMKMIRILCIYILAVSCDAGMFSWLYHGSQFVFSMDGNHLTEAEIHKSLVWCLCKSRYFLRRTFHQLRPIHEVRLELLYTFTCNVSNNPVERLSAHPIFCRHTNYGESFHGPSRCDIRQHNVYFQCNNVTNCLEVQFKYEDIPVQQSNDLKGGQCQYILHLETGHSYGQVSMPPSRDISYKTTLSTTTNSKHETTILQTKSTTCMSKTTILPTKSPTVRLMVGLNEDQEQRGLSEREKGFQLRPDGGFKMAVKIDILLPADQFPMTDADKGKLPQYMKCALANFVGMDNPVSNGPFTDVCRDSFKETFYNWSFQTWGAFQADQLLLNLAMNGNQLLRFAAVMKALHLHLVENHGIDQCNFGTSDSKSQPITNDANNKRQTLKNNSCFTKVKNKHPCITTHSKNSIQSVVFLKSQITIDSIFTNAGRGLARGKKISNLTNLFCIGFNLADNSSLNERTNYADCLTDFVHDQDIEIMKNLSLSNCFSFTSATTLARGQSLFVYCLILITLVTVRWTARHLGGC